MKYPNDFINKIICGDCRGVMKGIPDNSIDTIITDPPYGLSFMGKKWDYQVPSIEIWQECLRVLKLGGTALIFAGSRTQHRMAVNVEDAGFILKDCIMWLYGSGFPKASDISKQIDKTGGKSLKWFIDYIIEIATKRGISKKELTSLFPSKTGGMTGWLYNKASGIQSLTIEQYNKLKDFLDLPFETLEEAEREVIGKNEFGASSIYGSEIYNNRKENKILDITIPRTPEATLWNGWKSHGLKPAYEPILVAMKPNEGSYANNALKWGVAGLNIDGGRISYQGKNDIKKASRKNSNILQDKKGQWTNKKMRVFKPQGRYPANIILDEEAGQLLDEQSGNVGGDTRKSKSTYDKGAWGNMPAVESTALYNDTGGASRFFYCAKASKAERNRGCGELEEKERANINKMMGKAGNFKTGSGNDRTEKFRNSHPTIKPLALMKYLCTLTKTPTGGIVLDPFCGSGTTLMACKGLKRDYIGVDDILEYCEIARRRIKVIPEPLF
jgi:DNA modification methylase